MLSERRIHVTESWGFCFQSNDVPAQAPSTFPDQDTSKFDVKVERAVYRVDKTDLALYCVHLTNAEEVISEVILARVLVHFCNNRLPTGRGVLLEQARPMDCIKHTS
mmetsp:Transcript_39456/g.104300  ORF Transcript_39456/g.104300 Transcript_39456/m.104300 type:complete len:107 (+) Transcript_39456:121-441(+)